MATRRVKNVAYDDDDDDRWWESGGGDWGAGDWSAGGWDDSGWSSQPAKAKAADSKAKAKAKASTAKPAAAKPAAAKPAAAKASSAAPKASSSTAAPKAKAVVTEAKPATKPAAKASIDTDVLRLALGDGVDVERMEKALSAAGSCAEDAFLALLSEEIDEGRWNTKAVVGAGEKFDPPARAAPAEEQTTAAPLVKEKAKAEAKKATKRDSKKAEAQVTPEPEKPVEKELHVPEPTPEASDDTRPSISLVVVGHVDAGKSTLMGHLLCQVGMVSTKQLHKNKKESEQIGKASFAFAWVLDEGEDERSRGVTIDVCVKHFATDGRRFTILDAPGHRDFVPNMLAGAVQADVALLVADVSHFEAGFERGGQTKEHLQLVRSLGIGQVVVAVNKLDTCDWSQEVFEKYKEALHAFIVGPECGYKASSVQYIPMSGFTGENMLERKEPKLSAWWDGPTLIQALDRLPPPARPPSTGPLRIPISDMYKSGASLTISGKVESGTVSVGQKVVLLPSNEQTTVKNLQVHDGPVKSGVAGEYADGIVLPVEPQFACIGGALCDARNPVPVVDAFQAQVLVFDVDPPIMRGQQLMCYIHTETLTATLTKLEKLVIKGKPSDKKPKCLQKGNCAIVQIKVSRKVCVEPKPEGSAPATSLSRLVLRDRGRTVAAGVILAVS